MIYAVVFAAKEASGEAVAAAWIAAASAVLVSFIGPLLGLLAQRSTSRRIGRPLSKDGHESSVAEQLGQLTGHVLAVAEAQIDLAGAHARVERRVDHMEQIQQLCADCPRRTGLVPRPA